MTQLQIKKNNIQLILNQENMVPSQTLKELKMNPHFTEASTIKAPGWSLPQFEASIHQTPLRTYDNEYDEMESYQYQF